MVRERGRLVLAVICECKESRYGDRRPSDRLRGEDGGASVLARTIAAGPMEFDRGRSACGGVTSDVDVDAEVSVLRDGVMSPGDGDSVVDSSIAAEVTLKRIDEFRVNIGGIDTAAALVPGLGGDFSSIRS